MRVLLTGSSGQVGSALLASLKADITSPPAAEFDLSRPAELGGKLDAFRPDLIINPAAFTAVDRAEEDAELAFRINAEAPAAIAEWAARNDVPLIHFSTDYVFDGSGETPWRETSAPNPLSVYGASKLAGDDAIASAQGRHLIVRTSWVYAASGANFLRTIAGLARERKELQIVADQIGAPTSAKAISETLIRILPQSSSELDAFFAKHGGVLNVTCRGETSWHGFASAIVEGLRRRQVKLAVETIASIRSDEFPVKARRPLNSRLSLDRLQMEFGVLPATWQDALDHELDVLVAD